MKTLLAIAITLLLPFPSIADQPSTRAESLTNSNCPLNETAMINLNFSSVEKSVDTAVSYVDKKIAEVKAIVNKGKADKATLSGVNYNINPFNNGDPSSSDGAWQVSGNLSFNITPASKGKDILVLLSSHKYQPNLSVSSYQNGNCQ